MQIAVLLKLRYNLTALLFWTMVDLFEAHTPTQGICKRYNCHTIPEIRCCSSCHLHRSVEKVLHVNTNGDSSSQSCDQLDQLLPSKAGELELAKLPAPSRVVIYLLDGVPVLLDVSGKSDFVPTVMGLWSCPQLLPQVQLKHPAVSQFILSGAQCQSATNNLNSMCATFATI